MTKILNRMPLRRDEGGPDLLVRAQMDIPLERLSARNSARGQSASPSRAARVASAALPAGTEAEARDTMAFG